MESEHQVSPFDFERIFKHILEYVATDHDSILTCRLVAHSWNEMGLKVLRDNEAKIVLRRPDLGIVSSGCGINTRTDFRQFLNASVRTTESDEVILKSALSSLNLCFFVKTDDCEDSEDLKEPINQALLEIQRGHNLIISEIVYESVGLYYTQLRYLEFILYYCSSTLKDLRFIQRATDFGPPWSDNMFEDIGTFPNLNNISVLIGATGYNYLNPLIMNVINSSPNLRSLKIEWNTISPMSSTLREQLSPETRRRLQELTMPTPHWSTFEPIFFNGFGMGSLRNLELCIDPQLLQLTDNQEAFGNFLKNELPQLESLELVWDFKSSSVTFQQQQLQMIPIITLPLLPGLLHFGTSQLQLVPEGYNLFVNQFFQSMAERWTTMNTFSIDVCSLCALITRQIEIPQEADEKNKEPWYNDIEFPDVESLTLRVNLTLGFGDSVMEGCAGIRLAIASMFPNITKLSFTGNMTSRTQRIFAVHILPEILKLGGIRHLEFDPYYKNYVGQLDIKQKNIAKCVRVLVLKSTNSSSRTIKPEAIRVTELKQLIKNFPRLQLLTISSKLLLDNDGGTDFQQILTGTRRLRAIAPFVRIRII